MNSKNLLIIFVSSFVLFACHNSGEKQSHRVSRNTIQQIDQLLKESKKKALSDSIRLHLSHKALTASNIAKNDSLIARSYLQLTHLHYQLKYKDSFQKYYPKAIMFAKKSRDTLAMGRTHNYVAYFYLRHNKLDSAYTNFYYGSKYYKTLKNNFQSGKMLLNMAIIQKNKRDYKGSEEVTLEALKFLKIADSTTCKKCKKYIASAYNNLGIVNNEMKKLSVAVKYHKMALAIFKTLKNEPILTLESLNNIVVSYKNNGKYDDALAYGDSIKPYKELLEKHPVVKARVIDNIAHTKMLRGNISNVLGDMQLALSIRKKENHLTGIMVSYLHLSEYYRVVNDPIQSFHYAKLAKEFSQDHENYRDALNALRILTLNKTQKDNKIFIQEYYETSDKLEIAENAVADHFARIRLEADEKEKENKKAYTTINQQKLEIQNKNLIIGLLFGITLLILIILTVLYKSFKLKRRLYRDFNHRTNNSLTEIQNRTLRVKKLNESTLSIQELESSVKSQLLLYNILSENNHLTHIYFDEYLELLVKVIKGVYPRYMVSTSFNVEKKKISAEQALILGRIINEFLTNAYKHGFLLDQENFIKIYSKKDNYFTIVIETNGKEWNPTSSAGKGEGLLLIKSLSKKISGTVKIYCKNQKTFLYIQLKPIYSWKKLKF